MDELDAELVLEAAQALAHARLREPEPIGGAAEVQLFRQGKEHPDLAQLDRLPHREATLLAPLRCRQLIAAWAARILGPCHSPASNSSPSHSTASAPVRGRAWRHRSATPASGCTNGC